MSKFLFKCIFICMICFLFSGCNITDNNTIDNTNDIATDGDIVDVDNVEDIYVDDNPIKVSLYEGNKKISSYSTSLANFKDIGVFDIIYTDIDVLDSSNTKKNYNKYYNMYENIEEYKTGLFISFEADGKTIEELVLDPSSQHNMGPYLYIYLYDDVNQLDGTYYSHLEIDDYNEDSVISSFKLFFAQAGTSITSPISVTVFTYNDNDDFDEFNKYRGISSYTIEININ